VLVIGKVHRIALFQMIKVEGLLVSVLRLSTPFVVKPGAPGRTRIIAKECAATFIVANAPEMALIPLASQSLQFGIK